MTATAVTTTVNSFRCEGFGDSSCQERDAGSNPVARPGGCRPAAQDTYVADTIGSNTGAGAVRDGDKQANGLRAGAAVGDDGPRGPRLAHRAGANPAPTVGCSMPGRGWRRGCRLRRRRWRPATERRSPCTIGDGRSSSLAARSSAVARIAPCPSRVRVPCARVVARRALARLSPWSWRTGRGGPSTPAGPGPRHRRPRAAAAAVGQLGGPRWWRSPAAGRRRRFAAPSATPRLGGDRGLGDGVWLMERAAQATEDGLLISLRVRASGGLPSSGLGVFVLRPARRRRRGQPSRASTRWRSGEAHQHPPPDPASVDHRCSLFPALSRLPFPLRLAKAETRRWPPRTSML